jgi:aspartyl/asparaginyl-tRNA synthetase
VVPLAAAVGDSADPGHTVIDAIRQYFNTNGYVLIDTPIFAPSAGEGAQTLFEVDYFGEPVYLAQTGQLYVESACMAHGRVYCFGPTFRAEKSKTRRHLTEFWMVEPEIAYADLDEITRLPRILYAALRSACSTIIVKSWKCWDAMSRRSKRFRSRSTD